MQVHFAGFGRPLRNPLKRISGAGCRIEVRTLAGEVNAPPPEGGGYCNGLKVLFRPKAGKMVPAPSGLQEVDGLNRLL